MNPSSAGTSRSRTNKQTLAPRGCLSACLSDCRRDSVIHTNANTHLGISLPRLPPLVFSFSFGSRSLPSHSLCLQTQTNQSSFDLLEMSLAGERHFECDESVEGEGGLSEDASGERDGRYGGVSFQLRKLPSNSRAHYERLRVENCCSAVFFLCNSPPKKTAFLSHGLYPVVSTQDHIKPTREEHRVTRGCWPQGEGGTDQA